MSHVTAFPVLDQGSSLSHEVIRGPLNYRPALCVATLGILLTARQSIFWA